MRPTELLQAIHEMNAGLDYRGRPLRAPTDFCIGATIDMSRDLDAEVALTQRKMEAGAQFFLLQAVYDPLAVERFLEATAKRGAALAADSLFCGIQIVTSESLAVGKVPDWVTIDLEKGRSASDLGADALVCCPAQRPGPNLLSLGSGAGRGLLPRGLRAPSRGCRVGRARRAAR